MFVRAHADIYWDPYRTHHIILDDAMATTELFEEHPGLKEGAHRFVLIDLAQPWTRNVIRNLFRRVPDHVCLVVVSPVLVPDMSPACIVVNTQDMNENFQFMAANRHYFSHFQVHDATAFVLFHRRCRSNLARLMQRYAFGTDEVDVLDHLDPFAVRTLEEADHLLGVSSDFDYTVCGTLEWRALAMDIRSFCDTRMNNIYGTEEHTDALMQHFAASTWHIAMKQLCVL